MAAKKARKRAYIPPSSEVVNRRERTQVARTQRATTNKTTRGGAAAGAYPTPSLRRTMRRLPLYFVLIFALQYYLLGTGDKPIEGTDRLVFAAAQAGMVTLIFAPFMHMMDRLSYNRWLKRQSARSGSADKA